MATPFDTSGDKRKNGGGSDNNKRANDIGGGRGKSNRGGNVGGVEVTTTKLTILLPAVVTREATEEALMVVPSLMPRVSK